MTLLPSDATGPPAVRLKDISTTADRLELLLAEIVNRQLSRECYNLFHYLAGLTPFARLIYSLHTVMWLLKRRLQSTRCDARNYTLNVLIDGLKAKERRILMEIDASGAPLEVRRTAHSLLDLELRQVFVTRFGGAFKDRWERKRHRLINRPLDNTVKLEQ